MQKTFQFRINKLPTPQKNSPKTPQQKNLNPLRIKVLKMAPAVGIEPTT